MKTIHILYLAAFSLLAGGCSLQKLRKDTFPPPVVREVPADLQALKNHIEAVIKDKKATVGVAVILNGKDTLTINDTEKYPMMSVYKFHQALAVCRYLNQKNIPLSTVLHADKKFFKPNTYSPLRDKYPQGNIDLPVNELLSYTLQLSDNIACDILFDYIGGVKAADEYIHTLGIKDVSLGATEDEMHQNPEDCYKNWSTPLAAARLLEIFTTNEALKNEYTDFVKRTMTECQTGKDRLPAPLSGKGIIIGHKTGTSDKNSGGEYTGINDIGFVSLPDGRRYTIAVFIKNSREKMSTNIRMIADISAAVYSYVCQSIPVPSSGSKERKN